ncbi:retrovirus-related Pol polyprotein from transposon 17.6 [Trichonephila clavipes]|nr:retrovirus-related Pol polyprotein from transposon 17.6 [Trichonephila clavipes]
MFVKQKEKWRLVLDFRKLNEITLTQDFVIPTLDDILHEISGSNYFSALDMKSAFNQIPLHFSDRHKTAFSTPDGDKYQFNRLCFGLKNSPKAFQSIAQEVLGDLLHHGALVYIDDIILFTKTIDGHFELLGLREAGWSNRRIGRHLGRERYGSCSVWQQWITEYSRRVNVPGTQMIARIVQSEEWPLRHQQRR